MPNDVKSNYILALIGTSCDQLKTATKASAYHGLKVTPSDHICSNETRIVNEVAKINALLELLKQLGYIQLTTDEFSDRVQYSLSEVSHLIPTDIKLK